MIASFFRCSLWVVTFVLGNSIRKQQVQRSQFLQKYTQGKRDVLQELEMDDELMAWTDRLDIAPNSKVVAVLNPREEPQLVQRLLRDSEKPAILGAISEQLNRIEAQVAGLEAHLTADERGKLQANLEYVLDFSVSLTQTLLLAYAGQLEWQRFAVVLEEIELQSAQIMASIGERLSAFESRLLKKQGKNQLLHYNADARWEKYLRDRTHWIIGLQIRCSASLLRLCLPKSHQAFVYRQLHRVQRQVAMRRRMFTSADEIMANAPQSVTEAILNSIQDMLKLENRENDEQSLESSEPSIDQVLNPINRLLANPRASRKEIRRFISSSVSLVISTNCNGDIGSVYRLTKQPWYRRTSSTDEQSIHMVPARC